MIASDQAALSAVFWPGSTVVASWPVLLEQARHLRTVYDAAKVTRERLAEAEDEIDRLRNTIEGFHP